jgi:hypothetical protein
MTAETHCVAVCASGKCMRDLHMHMYCYDCAEVVLTVFRSISSNMLLNHKIQTARIKGLATQGVASNFEPNLFVRRRFNSVSRLERLFIRQLRPEVRYLASHSPA